MDVKTEPLGKGKLIRFFVPIYDKESEFVSRRGRDKFMRKIKGTALENGPADRLL